MKEHKIKSLQQKQRQSLVSFVIVWVALLFCKLLNAFVTQDKKEHHFQHMLCV